MVAKKIPDSGADAAGSQTTTLGLGSVEPELTLPPEDVAPRLAPVAPALADNDRLSRLESLFERFAGTVTDRFEQFGHIIDRLAQGSAAGEDDAPEPEKRVRPDERLAEMAADVTVPELMRMLELKGQIEEVGRLKAAGITPTSHWIANDCMAIGLLGEDGREVLTKVMIGDPIPKDKLAAKTLDWGLKHPEGAKFVRPGEYKAPKPTPAHTR